MIDRKLAGLLLLFAAIAMAQPAFEAATIKPADPGEPQPGDMVRNMTDSPGHLIMRNVPLRFAIEYAWDLKDYEVVGPEWFKNELRYDIVANASGPVPDDQLRPLLQTLLTERFHLKLHRETRAVDIYALLPGKGPHRLAEPKPGEVTALGPGPGTSAKFTNQPLSRMVFMLTRRMDRPVIDMTGIKGMYDFTLDTSGLGFGGNPPADSSAPSVFTTIQTDLGLRLQPQKTQLEILVIDQADKTPVAN